MAILQISTIQSDTRWAKEVRLFGIPIYVEREMDVRTRAEAPTPPKPERIGFKQIGNTDLLETRNDNGDNEEEN